MNDTELDDLIATLSGIRTGKPWQVATPTYPDVWADAKIPDPKEALNQGFHIRLKPAWALGREVNGHRLPEGREWFKPEKFREADLPEGYRPLMVGEDTVAGDEVFKNGFGPWVESGPRSWEEREHSCYTAPVRTKRPIVQPILTPAEIKPEPARVPLGPKDVPPGSVLRWALPKQVGWINVDYCGIDGLWLPQQEGSKFITWAVLSEKCEIQRPGQDWQPCWKEVA